VLDKRRHEQFQMAEYIARNVATVPERHGIDGGMNPVFASKLAVHSEFDNNGRVYQVAGNTQAPGALPRTPNPPVAAAETMQAPQPAASAPLVMASVPMPTPAPQPKEGEAPPEQPKTIAGLLGNVFGGAKAETKPAQPATENDPVALRGSKTEVAAAKPKHPSIIRSASAAEAQPKPRDMAPPQEVAVNVPEPAPKPRDIATPKPKAAETNAPIAAPKPRLVAQPVETPRAPEREMRTAYSAAPPASSNGLLAGAAPVVPVGAFDNRFSGR
jgi:hypothetical protein